MNILKASVMASCVIGVISTIADIITPLSSTKKLLRVITAIILTLMVITPFIGGIDIDIEGLRRLTDAQRYDALSEEFEQMYKQTVQQRLEQDIQTRLSGMDINVKKVVIDEQCSEYNSIEALKVTVYVDDMTDTKAEKINQTIKQLLPQSEIMITEDNSRVS